MATNNKLNLEFSDFTPVYIQMANHLTKLIQSGELEYGNALPSERALAEQYKVSRITARKAIDLLVEKKIIIRKHGSGNYILSLLEQPLNKLRSFSEEITLLGLTPSSVWLTRGISPASPDELKTLGLEAGSRVARLERQRLSDNQIIAYENSILPEEFIPQPENIEGSLYKYLESKNLLPVRATQHIRALNAPKTLAKLLNVELGHAVVFVRRVSYLIDGRPVEISLTYGKCEHYDFVVELNR